MTDGKREAQERFARLVDLMGEIGATDMGWLAHKDAARFHKATDVMVDLLEKIDPDWESKVTL